MRKIFDLLFIIYVLVVYSIMKYVPNSPEKTNFFIFNVLLGVLFIMFCFLKFRQADIEMRKAKEEYNLYYEQEQEYEDRDKKMTDAYKYGFKRGLKKFFIDIE